MLFIVEMQFEQVIGIVILIISISRVCLYEIMKASKTAAGDKNNFDN